MTTYKRIVYLAIGLVTVLFFGGLGDIFTHINAPFYENLIKPMTNNNVIAFINFLIYCIMAYIISESLMKKNNRHDYILWISLLSLELISTITLFVLHSLYLTFTLHFLIVVVAISMLMSYINNYKYLGFFMLPVVIWYAYLFMFNYSLLILN